MSEGVDFHVLHDVVVCFNNIKSLLTMSERRVKLLIRLIRYCSKYNRDFEKYISWLENLSNTLHRISEDVDTVGRQVVSKVEEEYRKSKKE